MAEGFRGPNSNAATLRLKEQYFCNGVEKTNKLQMIEIAKNAFDELLHLLHVDEPVWIKSPNDGTQLIIHRHSYDKLFRRPNHFTGSSHATAPPRFESSKDSIVVQMKAPDLAKMFRDPVRTYVLSYHHNPPFS